MDGIRVTGLIMPTSELDDFAVTDEQFHKGGYRSVADSTARYAIPLERRSLGMLVKERSSGLYYTLEGGISDSNWKIEELGGGTSTIGELVLLNADLW